MSSVLEPKTGVPATAAPAADLDAYWMPFTANRQFKKAPRLLQRSSGMHYWNDQGRQILDGVAFPVLGFEDDDIHEGIQTER